MTVADALDEIVRQALAQSARALSQAGVSDAVASRELADLVFELTIRRMEMIDTISRQLAADDRVERVH